MRTRSQKPEARSQKMEVSLRRQFLARRAADLQFRQALEGAACDASSIRAARRRATRQSVLRQQKLAKACALARAGSRLQLAFVRRSSDFCLLTSALHASRFFPGRFTDIMSIPMGPHGRWVARHLQDTVCGAAQRAGVDRQSLNKFARGMPKVIGGDREEAVYRVYRLTPRQFAWNVKVGWHGKKSYEPGRTVGGGQLSVISGRRAEGGTGKSEIPARPAGGRNPQSAFQNPKPKIGFNREGEKARSSASVQSVKSVDSSRLPAFAVRSSIRNPKPAVRNPKPGLRDLRSKSEIRNQKSKIPKWLCRPDLCRLSGRCPAARRRDFSGRTRRACAETEKRK